MLSPPCPWCGGASGWGCHSGGSAGAPSLAGSEGCGNPQPRSAAPLPLPFTPGCFAGSTMGVMSSPCRWRQVLSIPSRLFYLQVLYEKREGQTKSVLWGFSPGDTCDMRFKLKYHTVSHVNITNRVFLSFLRPGRTFPAEARDRCS